MHRKEMGLRLTNIHANHLQDAEEVGAESQMRSLPAADLLQHLPVMQKLMERLMDCLPKGAAANDWVVQMALLTVAKESFQVHSNALH